MNKTALNAEHTKAFYEIVSIPLRRTSYLRKTYFFALVLVIALRNKHNFHSKQTTLGRRTMFGFDKCVCVCASCEWSDSSEKEYVHPLSVVRLNECA